MSRPRTDLLAVLLVLLAVVGSAPVLARVAPQDEVADWLEARSLDRLLIEHLEAARSTAARDDLADTRLAEAYARLIESEDDEAVRNDLVDRARRLLVQMPASTSVPLQLALARVRYLGAQRVLERSRVAEVEAPELERRRVEMADLARELEPLVEQLERRAIATRRRGGSRRDQELDELARWKGAATLLAAWCWYYRGTDGTDMDLAKAQRAFGTLLSGGESIPDVDELSDDRKAYEWYASAILGMAMTEAARISTAAATPWFEALRSGDVHVAVADIVDGWQLAAHLDAKAFRNADALLTDLADRGTDMPTAWLRMAAVAGLRGRSTGDGEAVKLSQNALAMLAAGSEFAAIAALVGTFGLDSIDQRGFVFDYIRGLERYREAAEANTRGDEAAKRSGLSDAAAEFEAAIRASDAINYPDAANACRVQLAKVRLDLGAHRDALAILLEVIPDVSGEARADAIWWAIVSCDRILADDGTSDRSEIGDRRGALSRQFLQSYPTDPRAPQLMIQRISREEDPALEDLEILLALSPDHPSWRSSRERAFTVLYRRFRRAEGEARRDLGRRALEVAASLEAPRFENDRIDPAVALQRDRIVAEILTTEGLEDRARAERVFERIEAATGADVVPGLADEMQYRRLMLELLEEDFVGAVRRVRSMPVGIGAASASWADLAIRQLHATAVERARVGLVPPPVADAIVASGERRFLEVTDVDAPVDWSELLGRDDLLAVAVNLANAHRARFLSSGDTADAEAALLWFTRSLERRPNDGGLLESAAGMSSALDDRSRTIDLWRRILNRADRGTPLWWKAKVGQLEEILVDDPDQARRILDQVRALEPDFGPEPWRTRMLEVARRLDSPFSDTRPEPKRGVEP